MKYDTLTIPITQVTPNPWNPNAQAPDVYAAQVESLRRYGFVAPIVVRETHAGTFEIIDGEHRYRAAQEIGIAEIPVYNLGNVDDVKARQLTEVFIHLKGMPDVQREAALLKELQELTPDGDALADLAAVLPQTEDTLRSLVDAASFDWDSFAAQTPDPLPVRDDATATNTRPEERSRENGEPTALSAPDAGDVMVALTITGLGIESRDRVLEAMEATGQETQALALLALADCYLGRE